MNEQHYIERYWRDATPEDAINEPPMMARFRNSEEHVWVIGPLMGIRRDNFYQWYSTNLGSHKECQVYDAPDPGEGWRLIDIESTTRLPSDERWYPSLSKWLSPDDCYCDRYQDGCFYRRRIEPPNPEPRYEPFRWEDREQLRGRWVQCAGIPCGEWMITTMYLGSHGELRVNSVDAERLRTGYVFADTGEPVGRRVE